MQCGLEIEDKATWDAVGKWLTLLPARMNKVLQRLLEYFAVYATNEVMRLTPVDTGRARGSWLPLLEAQGFAVMDAASSAWLDFAGIRSDRVVIEGDAGAIAEGRAKGSFEIAYLNVTVTSNLEYIQLLEEGYSGQAPEGMVGITMHLVTPKFEAALRKAAAKIEAEWAAL